VILSAIIGDVAGRDVIILDDEIARGTTVFELLTLLREQDVRSVAVACTHGLFADGALDKLAASDVTEIVCTNSVPLPPGPPEAARAVGSPRAGRGHQPDPQRRIGQRPVRPLAPAPKNESRAVSTTRPGRARSGPRRALRRG